MEDWWTAFQMTVALLVGVVIVVGVLLGFSLLVQFLYHWHPWMAGCVVALGAFGLLVVFIHGVIDS